MGSGLSEVFPLNGLFGGELYDLSGSNIVGLFKIGIFEGLKKPFEGLFENFECYFRGN